MPAPIPPKIDLLKSLKIEYAAPRQPRFVDPTPGRYLQVEGDGPPGGPRFEALVGALYAVAYTLKFRRKLHGGPDYGVAKMEGIWTRLPERREDDDWAWRLLIRVPDFITRDELAAAIAALLEKKKPETVREVALAELHEGRCVQMLHVGPYDQEPATFALMRDFAAAQGYQPAGHPHEIYVSDPRRVEPARLKTILRLPVRPLA